MATTYAFLPYFAEFVGKVIKSLQNGYYFTHFY